MEDSNPTSSSTASTSHPVSDPSIRPPRHSHIHFPPNGKNSSRHSFSPLEDSPSSLPLALKPAAHKSLLVPGDGSDPSLRSDSRRRVRSADVANDHLRSRRLHVTSADGIASNSPRKPKKDKGKESHVLDEFGPAAFSNEYDLSQDDPRILQDVQRALKLKAQRESRLKGMRSHSPLKDPKPDAASASELPGTSSPAGVLFPAAQDPARGSNAGLSELDFSPSVGTVPLHPVPTTSDDGVTLDWSGSVSDDEKSERRWTLSISKRKGKDRVPPTPHAVERQISLYTDKLSRIKDGASHKTLRKAAITSDQLRRRYDIIYGSLGSRRQSFNPVDVVRWYGSREPLVRSSLDAAEPLTWLKHLFDKRRQKSSERIPWHLTSLIAEEYIKYSRRDAMATIPEDATSEARSPVDPSPSPQGLTWQANSSRPKVASHYSFGPSISRKRSIEGHVSFEPVVESARSSVEGDSRRNIDGISRVFRHSLPGVTSSPHSSIHSIFSGTSSYYPSQPTGAASPSSSRLHLRDFANRISRRRPPNDSDGASSPHDSLSEDHHTRSDDGGAGRQRKRGNRPTNLDLPSRHGTVSDQEHPITPGNLLEPFELKLASQGGHLTAKNASKEIISDGEPTALPRASSQEHSLEATTSARATRRSTVRISMPSSDGMFSGEERKRQQEANEEKEREEYDLKARMLDDMVTQNQRIRYLLQRIAAGVREYELLQSKLMKSLGLPHRSIPQELLDAFSHDPSSVTGSTRRFRGWRAVDDIQNRIVRQRETFRIFLSVTASSGIFPPPESVLEDPITSLLRNLETLDGHHQDIAKKAQDVAEVLANVKEIHTGVKKQYNEALSYTSVVYPELSDIVGLEESFKDQYQQFWELGMDALTFLLDTVTPFWRNYGKTIGEDVQDFLVIPLYRNEFTGEPKRYPLTRLPKRSFRHWMGLFLFLYISAMVTFLQTRAAVSSTAYYKMPIITHTGLWWLAAPFFWIAVCIQWSAVVTEFCICLAELGVIAWWVGWSIKIFT